VSEDHLRSRYDESVNPATRKDATLRVAVVEDDPRYRESLEMLFRHTPGFSLAASFPAALPALRAAEALAGQGRLGWDLVLMDLGLPDLSGIEATRALKKLAPHLRVVALTVFEDPPRILDAICSGADGYLLKRTPPQELLAQLQLVRSGGAPLTAGVATVVLGFVRGPEVSSAGEHRDGNEGALTLSAREQGVLRAMTRGLAYKQVADELGISIDTVRTHIRSIYEKLQVHSATEAVSRALRDRLV
jgi:DNA-binding NarL/FixJ family response regulator